MNGLYGLLYGCPWQEDSDNCAFRKIREIDDLEERLILFEEMRIEHKKEVLSRHHNCNNAHRFKIEKLKKHENLNLYLYGQNS